MTHPFFFPSRPAGVQPRQPVSIPLAACWLLALSAAWVQAAGAADPACPVAADGTISGSRIRCTYTVPNDGAYQITAYGASGQGYGVNVVSGKFTLAAGRQLTISLGDASGGGITGSSGVLDNAVKLTPSYLTDNLLIVSCGSGSSPSFGQGAPQGGSSQQLAPWSGIGTLCIERSSKPSRFGQGLSRCSTYSDYHSSSASGSTTTYICYLDDRYASNTSMIISTYLGSAKVTIVPAP